MTTQPTLKIERSNTAITLYYVWSSGKRTVIESHIASEALARASMAGWQSLGKAEIEGILKAAGHSGDYKKINI